MALRPALQTAFGWAPGALLEGPQDHAEVVAVVQEKGRRQSQHFLDTRAGGPDQFENHPVHGVFLGAQQPEDFRLEQDQHGVHRLHQQRTFGFQLLPFNLNPLDEVRYLRRILRRKQSPGEAPSVYGAAKRGANAPIYRESSWVCLIRRTFHQIDSITTGTNTAITGATTS